MNVNPLVAWRTATNSPRSSDVNMTALVEASLRPIVDEGKVVGMAVGIIAPSGRWVYGLGTTSKDARLSRIPTGKTVFEIGSISKAFTGILLADAVIRGEVALDDPVNRLLPDDVKVPSRDGKEITLLHLATHASGLPRLPNNLKLDLHDPYRDYSDQDLYRFLSAHTLKRDPGERSEYSNLGMGLLGFALTRRAGKARYQDLVIERIAEPLHMRDTLVTLNESMQTRLAEGHTTRGVKTSNWTFETLAGAGGLRSTVDDMGRLAAFVLNPDDSTLGKAVRLAITPQRSLADGGPEIGLAWIVHSNGTLFHNGQTGGYHSFIGIRPDRGTALVVLGNSATEAIDEAADQLLESIPGRVDRVRNAE